MSCSDKTSPTRVSINDLSLALSNIGNAYHRGASPSVMSELKQKYQSEGIESLYAAPLVPKSHPKSTPPATVQRILGLCLEHPGWGCIRISEHLKKYNIKISSPTVQNILIKYHLGTKTERLNALETNHAADFSVLSDEQLHLLEAANPCLRERNDESVRPGEVLAQDTLFLKSLKHLGKLYLHIVIDTFSSYAFGLIHPSKVPDCAVALLHNDVLPFFRGRQLPVAAVITNKNREYYGGPRHHYQLYLALNEIDHRVIQSDLHRTNGFIERFENIAVAEFFNPLCQAPPLQSVEQLQEEFERWLHHYNAERPHDRYRNLGAIPLQRIGSSNIQTSSL
ncbi:homeodomain-containing protein [Hydrogenispora ethanolica]|uniref:Homeodomain-containing protein n=1 Tax=Hydrogenispora ethanolica TaxID=1082276 RepID=A0A4R1S822_HYDET|nr:helix-turn-helix domain-containing protein [Hydrogenispora ethanolica]TCL75254.1 homeodomain-containing protein [Hydrogenispora ethanolica]